MSNEREIYDVAMRGYQAAMSQERAAYEQAQLSGDFQEAVRASQSLASIQAQANQYHQMATQHVQAMQPVQSQSRGGKFVMDDKTAHSAASRLTDDEIEAAQISGVSEAEYARNKAKMEWMRATGKLDR